MCLRPNSPRARPRPAPAARSPPIYFAATPPLRLYAAECAGEITGWVESIVCPAGTWCASMFVQPAHRRQGIASALLATMLRDDRRTGAPGNVLLATHAGAKLYATLGYRQLGTLLLYTPQK